MQDRGPRLCKSEHQGFKKTKDRMWGSKMGNGTQTQTAWAPGIRDLAEMLEICLAKVKHQGELKLQHPELIACGRFLHITIHWKNRWAAAHPLAFWTPTMQACQTTAPLGFHPTNPLVLHPTRQLPANPLGCLQPTSQLAHQPPPATGGLQHHKTPAPNLPRWHRQKGLDA
jgi:hypothetical protein